MCREETLRLILPKHPLTWMTPIPHIWSCFNLELNVLNSIGCCKTGEWLDFRAAKYEETYWPGNVLVWVPTTKVLPLLSIRFHLHTVWNWLELSANIVFFHSGLSSLYSSCINVLFAFVQFSPSGEFSHGAVQCYMPTYPFWRICEWIHPWDTHYHGLQVLQWSDCPHRLMGSSHSLTDWNGKIRILFIGKLFKW